MKLSLRFVLLVLALLVGVAASATSGWRALTSLDLALDGVVKGDMGRLLAITHTRRLFRSLVVLERDYLLSTSAEERTSMDRKFVSTSNELSQQIDGYATLMPPEDKAAVQQTREVSDRWLALDARVREAARKGDRESLALSALHAKDPVSWEGVIGALVKSNEARLQAQVKATHATYLSARRTLLGVSAGAALFAAGFGYVIFMGIRRTVGEVVLLNTNLEGILKVRTEALAARERSEHASRESDQRFRAILDSAPDAVLMVDEAGNVVLTNSTAQELFGAASHSLVGNHWRTLFASNSEFAEESWDAHGPDGDRNHRSPQQVAGLRHDGSSFPAEVTRSTLETSSGRWSISVVRDVTGRQLLEQQLNQSQKMEAIGQLTGGIAHDFNNLLGVVVGNLDLLERAVAQDPKATARVEKARNAALRGADLTRRLLAFSRKQHLEPRAIRLAETIPELVEMARRTLGPDIQIVTTFEDNVPTVHADPAALESALLNLAVNARDAMPDGGTITFTTTLVELDHSHPAVRSGDLHPGFFASIRVSDTGCGMPHAVLERVFEPFFTTKERGKGTGLGLAMVYGFAKQSGGNVRIYSELGIGTTVSILLPISDREAGVALEKKFPVSTHMAAAGATALVVDDEPDLLEVACTYLEEMGYRVLQASDGPSALAILEQEPRVDLLVTDVIMPGGMNGVRLTESVLKLRPEVKVLFTSGFPSQALAQRSGTKIDGPLLSKPYVRRDFTQLVHSVMVGRAA